MKEKIPDRLKDPTTRYKNHTWLTHLFCVLIRLILAFLIMSSGEKMSTEKKGIILTIFIMAIILFGYKFIYVSDTWKPYLRATISYILVTIFVYFDKYDTAGTLLMVDTLMGVQARHNAVMIELMKSSSSIP